MSVPARELPVVIIDGTGGWARWWADLRDYRGALQSLAWRNLRSRYKQSLLGVLWALLQPAVQVGVFTLLFGVLAHIPSDGVPYALFALAGLLPWNFFSKVVSEGAQSLVVNQNIITKLFFPRVYLVIAAGASAAVDGAVTLALLLGAMAWYGVWPGPHAWLVLPALLGVVLLSFGMAALLAALNARWRDVQHTLPFLLQVGMLATPVIYRASFVPGKWRWLLALNPLTGLIEVFRSAMLGLPLPDRRLVMLSLFFSVTATLGGVWLFRRTESIIVDVV
ncbi:MAG: ABC transporter permease [Gemmatimonadaceae bacterium]